MVSTEKWQLGKHKQMVSVCYLDYKHVNHLYFHLFAVSFTNLLRRCSMLDVQQEPRNDRVHDGKYSDTFWKRRHQTVRIISIHRIVHNPKRTVITATNGRKKILPLVAQCLPSVLWHCWLGVRKSIQPVKKSDEVQIICIWSSWCNCHPIISCFIKI